MNINKKIMKIKLEKGDIIELNGIFYRVDGVGSSVIDPVLSRISDKCKVAIEVDKDDYKDSMPISELGLSQRPWNILANRLEVKTLGDIRKLKLCNLRYVRNVGPVTIKEIQDKINRYYGKPVL